MSPNEEIDLPDLRGTRVLVVEDEDDTRELLGSWLATHGLVVQSASSVDEAFTMFRRERPQIVISDVAMPGQSGRELVARIRALSYEDGGFTPIIALSGVSEPEETIPVGFHFHFKKPVDPALLLAGISDFVRGQRIGRAQWSVNRDGGDLLVRIVGHVTAVDMRSVAAVMLRYLEASPGGYRVVVDLRELTGFDPSAAFVGQTAMWHQRHQLRGVVIIGGSPAARLVASAACRMLGVDCQLADDADGSAVG